MAAWKSGPLGQYPWTREYQFLEDRKWRLDFAFPSLLIAVEIEGRGRHQTIAGVRADCDKYNRAAELGWRIFRFPATDIKHRNEWGESNLDLFVDQVASVVCQARPVLVPPQQLPQRNSRGLRLRSK